MTGQYALMPEEQITVEAAKKFKVVSNFATIKVFASHLVTDASGQVSEIFDEWVQLRFVESDVNGFTQEHLDLIETAKGRFNNGRTRKIDFPVVGNSEWARSFDTGRKLKDQEPF